MRRVLFIGDIAGEAGVELVCRRVPELREARGLAAVVANAENSAPDGAGLPASALERLLAAGVDVVTGGNHSWDHRDSDRCLAHPRVIRPLNVADGTAGRGTVTVPLEGRRPLTVINVADRDALSATPRAPNEVTDILEAVDDALAADGTGDVIVDAHAEHVFTKQALAYALDGRVTAVLGTHSHEATLRLRVLPRGTGLVTEVGMTGSQAGVMGFTPEPFVRGLRTGVVADGRATPTPGPAELSSVLLVIDDGGGLRRLERVS